MKREIKFRAWHKDFGEMVYTKGNSIYGKREFSPFVFEVGFSHYPEQEWEIMQWTGLKDNAGKEIYEGDIIDYGDMYGEKEISFLGGSFGVLNRSKEGTSFGSYKIDDGYVIGNVHEHPELLSGRHEA